ncbi:hypothetical protein ACJW31_11G191600 [Castanea mollissima]
MLYQYILFNCTVSFSVPTFVLTTLGLSSSASCISPLMIYEIFENMLRLKKLQTFIFALIRYFKLPSWILHIPSYCQSHPKAIIVDLHFHVQTNLIFHSDFHYHKSSTNPNVPAKCHF